MTAQHFTISFDDQLVPVIAGQTIAAALIASGHIAWRSTRVDRAPRGMFCGIGVCFDCLVTVNDVSGVRACLAVAEPGDVVVSEQGVDGDGAHS